jgi:hypothetical protein
MQAFMLYMSGGGVQVFSMGIVFMLLLSPFKNVAGINTGALFIPAMLATRTFELNNDHAHVQPLHNSRLQVTVTQSRSARSRYKNSRTWHATCSRWRWGYGNVVRWDYCPLALAIGWRSKVEIWFVFEYYVCCGCPPG